MDPLKDSLCRELRTLLEALTVTRDSEALCIKIKAVCDKLDALDGDVR